MGRQGYFFRITQAAQIPNGFYRLARAVLSVDATTLSVTFPTRRYLIVQIFSKGKSLAGQLTLIANSDGAANYAYRSSTNGAADATATAATYLLLEGSAITTVNFLTLNILNILAEVKRVYASSSQGSVAAATAPGRREFSGIWVNTTAQIITLTLGSDAAGDLLAGAEISVYGAD